MAYVKRKRSFKKRPSYRRRRVAYRAKRKMRRPGLGKTITQKTISVRMRSPDTTLTTSTLVDLLGGFDFAPALQLINWVNFATIFDSFIVNKVMYRVTMPINTLNIPADDVTGTASQRKFFFSCLDHDSPGLSIGSLDDIQAYANCKQTTFPRTHTRTWTPRVYSTIRRSSVANAYIPVKQQYLDVATGDLVLSPRLIFGIGSTPIVYQLSVHVDAWITFKNIRGQ